MNILDGDMTEKQKIQKYEIAKRLYYLNYYSKVLKNQRDGCTDEKIRKNIVSEMNELYRLKKKVLIKMVKDGFAFVQRLQIGNKLCYCIIRVTRDFTFHLPISNELVRAVNGNKKNQTVLCSKEQKV